MEREVVDKLEEHPEENTRGLSGLISISKYVSMQLLMSGHITFKVCKNFPQYIPNSS